MHNRRTKAILILFFPSFFFILSFSLSISHTLSFFAFTYSCHVFSLSWDFDQLIHRDYLIRWHNLAHSHENSIHKSFGWDIWNKISIIYVPLIPEKWFFVWKIWNFVTFSIESLFDCNSKFIVRLKPIIITLEFRILIAASVRLLVPHQFVL